MRGFYLKWVMVSWHIFFWLHQIIPQQWDRDIESVVIEADADVIFKEIAHMGFKIPFKIKAIYLINKKINLFEFLCVFTKSYKDFFFFCILLESFSKDVESSKEQSTLNFKSIASPHRTISQLQHFGLVFEQSRFEKRFSIKGNN